VVREDLYNKILREVYLGISQLEEALPLKGIEPLDVIKT
jgi:hypothetical protein